MDRPGLGWRGRIAMLSQWPAIRRARKRRLVLRNSMSAEQWEDLTARVDEITKDLSFQNLPDQLRSFLFSPEAMLCHPLLVAHIGPAVRFASAAGYETSSIPVISSPKLTFGGQARELQPSNLRIAEIPLGLVMLLRELGRGILNLHNAIQYNQPQNIELFGKVCSALSDLAHQPAPVAFYAGESFFRKTSFKYKIFRFSSPKSWPLSLCSTRSGIFAKIIIFDPPTKKLGGRNTKPTSSPWSVCLRSKKKTRGMRLFVE